VAHQEGHKLVLLNTLGLTGAELTRATIENNRRRREFEQASISERPPVPPVKPKPKAPIGAFKLNMSQMREKIGNLALTNQYAVNIVVPQKVIEYIRYYESDSEQVAKFSNEKLGFLCSEATLPVSSYATAEVKDNYLGITQEFAHTRLYTDIDFTFYVDNNYYMIRFFELWMDYISGGSNDELRFNGVGRNSTSYYRRFSYPRHYKTNMTITKFERDYKTHLEYDFVNAFPKGLTSIPVSYGSADLLKITATFNYDRYFINKITSEESVDVAERLRTLKLS
jgi:hypothetical protein